MKAAYHFDSAVAGSDGTSYGYRLLRRSLSVSLGIRTAPVASKVLEGDLLLLNRYGFETTYTDSGSTSEFDPAKYEAAIAGFVESTREVWSRSLRPLVASLRGRRDIAVVCFETLPHHLAEHLHGRFEELEPSYLGALEVDDAKELHWELYSHSLVPRLRLAGSSLSLFWDGFTEDSQDTGLATSLERDLSLRAAVTFESLAGRHSILDRRHEFNLACKAAESRRRFGYLLAFVAEEVIDRLGDAAPELPERLWSGLRAFENAETGEDLAHVAATCRRVLEYVADQVFPPSDIAVEGHKVGEKEYRNRLLAFAARERRGSTSVDLVVVSVEALSGQLEKLLNLANKGLHASVLRDEARRCLLRTLLALDDIASMKVGPFPMKVELDVERLFEPGADH